ncbi:hypothetical protein LRT82_004467 [Salmonella enterica]|nr:hypothetical protein [Salmonella enterica]
MKLIELLVQKNLSGHFEWPEYAGVMTQDSDMAVNMYRDSSDLSVNESGTWRYSSSWIDYAIHARDSEELASDYATAVVTREQYEAALASALQPVWNGEGLPPFDLLCEWRNDSGAEPKWEEGYLRAKINTESGELLVIEPRGGYALEWRGMHAKFRPIRSGADKKRETAINAILDDMRTIPCDLDLRDEVAVIYDAIAAGKIPGVKLDV